jgi:anthranilate phosphoribosyltransferase
MTVNALHAALKEITRGNYLDEQAMREAFTELMRPGADMCLASGFLCALSARVESAQELAAATMVMRSLCTPVPLPPDLPTLDTCGTGGDGAGLFNVSTAAALVAAAGGAYVVKHGNRAASGKTGSADVLEALGLNIALEAEQVGRCVNEVGIGFMFAPMHHAAMKNIIPVRQALGVPTLFNLLGPLSNPAGARRQLLGVGRADRMELMAETLLLLGCEHVLIVHSEDGLDEISPAASTKIIELKNGNSSHYQLVPEDFSMKRFDGLQALCADSPARSADLIGIAINPAHARERHPASMMVALNGGAALYVGGQARTLKDGVAMAEDLLCSGQVKTKLGEWLACVRAIAPLKGV